VISEVTGQYGCTHHLTYFYNSISTDTILGYDTVYVTRGGCSSCINVRVSDTAYTESFQEEAQTALFFHNTSAANYTDDGISFGNNFDSVSYTRSASAASGATTIHSYLGRRIK
jgi:hypothetical protein